MTSDSRSQNTYQMVELPQRHFSANVLAHGDQGDGDDSKGQTKLAVEVLEDAVVANHCAGVQGRIGVASMESRDW